MASLVLTTARAILFAAEVRVMTEVGRIAVALVLMTPWVVGCGKSSNDDGPDTTTGGTGAAGGTAVRVCVPTATEVCDCEPAVGARHCRADGSGWSECECATYGVQLAVSPTGSDTATGAPDAPFATLDRAQEAVRALVADGLPEGGAVVWLREGSYARDASFALGPEDSGTEGRPVVYRGYPGESARLVGGVRLDGADFTTISSDSPVWARLDESARDRIVQLDLSGSSVTDFGTLVRRGFCGSASESAPELFVDGIPMVLARWPDRDEDEVPELSTDAERVEVFGELSPDVTGVYLRDGEQDNASSFSREGLVDGVQYHLYRRTWEYEGAWHTAWFLTPDETGYPTSSGPWWYLYSHELGTLQPSADAGATGSPTFVDPAAINNGFAFIASAESDTAWHYSGNRPDRWASASEIWFHGYWRYHWADCRQVATSIDLDTRTVTFDEVPGYGIAEGMPYYAFNLLEELTQPGEWYLERDTGVLYLFPPTDLANAEILVSTLTEPLLRLDDAQFVEVRDLTLEASRGQLVRITGGADNVLAGVSLRNAGADAARITGTRNGMINCDVAHSANGGVVLAGGDRPSLTPAGNYVEDCSIHDFGRIEWTYRPGVRVEGVGQRVAHNRIHDAPHAAILFGGNEHLIELNEVHDVVRFSSDAGAIYSGRDWGARGNRLRHNFIHHVATSFTGGPGAQGIYLDDCVSGIEVFGNVLYKIQHHAIQNGGGRDNIIANNVIARCGDALAADSRGHDWRPDRGPNDTPGDSWNLLEKLQAVGYQDEPWASAYPECALIPSDWEAIIAEDATWTYPEGCVFSRNIGWQNQRFVTSLPPLEHYAEVADNVEDIDPRFVDEDQLDLSLAADSPVLDIPGFEPIPFAQIGIR